MTARRTVNLELGLAAQAERNGCGKDRGKAKHWISSDVAMPSNLAESPQFLEVWREWVPYFCYGKIGDQAPALRMQLKKLADYRPADAAEILENCIAKGYRVFELRAAKPESRTLIEQETERLVYGLRKR